MTPGLFTTSMTAAVLLAAGTLAGAVNSSGNAYGTAQADFTIGSAASGAPVVMRAEKESLLVGAHVDGAFVIDGPHTISRSSTDAPQTTPKEDKLAGRGWFDETLRFFERSSERTWRRTAYVSQRLSETVVEAF